MVDDGLSRKTSRNDGLTDAATVAGHDQSRRITNGQGGTVNHSFYGTPHRNPSTPERENLKVEVVTEFDKVFLDVPLEHAGSHAETHIGGIRSFGNDPGVTVGRH